MFDGKAFGQEVVAAVKAHVDKSLAPVLARLDDLEASVAEAAKAAVHAERKNEVSLLAARVEALESKLAEPPAVSEEDLAIVKDEVLALRKAIADLPASAEAPTLPDIHVMVAEAVAALPKPEDGKSVDLDAVAAQVKELVESALAGWERPQDGKSVTVEELAPMVAESIKAAVAAIPAPKDGCGVKDLLIDRDGALVATMDDGRMKSLGVVVGRDGADVDMAAVERSIAEKVAAIPKPKDGKDGFALKHFDASLMDDGRTVLLSLEDDERSVKVELGFPVVIDRGVYKEDGTYAKGDGVTWGGCFWIAQVDNPEGKPDSGKGWRLAVKKGRDGKDFTPKPDNGPAKVKV